MSSSRQSIRGGYRMIYKTFEEAMVLTCKSGKDIQVLWEIINTFTYRKIEVALSYANCTTKVSQPQYTRLVSRLVKYDLLKRISRGVYRLNPFMYIPYKSDGILLQKEWEEL